ncbi:MAG: glycosyltransferase [Paracoccaceae bacterium]|nr:MAG: glycosyltransferase [Paracoccaceae bacterium]
MNLRVMFYVQHLLGVGHLARASRIARAMQAAGLQVTLVTGGHPVPGFPGDGVAQRALPPVAVGDGAFAGLVDATGAPADAAFLDRRRDLLLAALRDLAPDVVMTEAFPFGRRQMRFELLPLLDAIAAMTPRPRLVASVRDILQARAKPGRDAETVATIRAHYDRVLVHGDPGFVRLEDTFPLAHQIADRVAYTGLVCGPPPDPSPDRFDVVVSAGGGAVGQGVSSAAIAAAARLPAALRWLVITGPNLPEADAARLAALAPPQVTLARFRPDFPQVLAAARLSVSQAGYNTVGDILQAGCRAVLVPYAAMGETEQGERAARLAALGRATVLAEDALTGDTLAAAIRDALDSPPPARIALRTDGAAETARCIAALAGDPPSRTRG